MDNFEVESRKIEFWVSEMKYSDLLYPDLVNVKSCHEIVRDGLPF